jgi:hypothetical protein
MAALDRGNRGRHHPVEFVKIHGMIQGLFSLIKNGIELSFFCATIQAAMTFLERLAADSKVFTKLANVKLHGWLGPDVTGGHHKQRRHGKGA